MKFILSLSIIYMGLSVVLLLSSFLFNINIKFTKNQFAFFLVLSSLSLSFIAFGTDPFPEMDLYRYYTLLDKMRYGGLDYVLTRSPYRATIVINMIFYLVSLINVYNLLPFISTLITTLCISYVIYKERERFNIASKVTALYIFSLISSTSLILILTGVRQHLALSIILVALYRDLIEDKKKFSTLLIYTVSLLIHFQIIPIIAIRMASFFLKGKIYKFRYILMFWAGFIPFFDFNYNNEYLYTAYNKLLGYSQYGFFDMRLYYATLMFFLVLCICIFLVSKEKEVLKEMNLENYIRFYNIISLFTFGSMPIHQLFVRLAGFNFYLSLPVLAVLFRAKDKYTRIVIILTFLFFVSGLSLYQISQATHIWRLTDRIFNSLY